MKMRWPTFWSLCVVALMMVVFIVLAGCGPRNPRPMICVDGSGTRAACPSEWSEATNVAWKWRRIGIPETTPTPPGHGGVKPCQRPASQGCKR